jgi:hypothetical protein
MPAEILIQHSQNYNFMENLTNLLNSDIQTSDSKRQYLSYAKNVLNGHNSELSITGNAFHVIFVNSTAIIESLWDETAEDQIIDLQSFISTVSNWATEI